jgi:hypothetical protein
VEPIYSGTTLAIPQGSIVKGHISSISTAARHAKRLLQGDFTSPRIASVSFEQIVLPDGKAIQIHTETTIGISGVKMTQYSSKSQRPGVRQAVANAASPMREPNKIQRLSQAAVTSLPYHPQYLDQGTTFDATLVEPVQTTVPVEQADASSLISDGYLHIRLLTPLNSGMIARGAAIEAVVPRPYYNSDHVLLYPAGTKLEGTVNQSVAAGWMKKNGQLLFSFNSAQTPDGNTTKVIATVAGVEAPRVERLAVGQEGQVKATTSILSQLRAPLSFIGPSRAAADTSLDKTAWSRAGEGNRGFGLLGAGAAQASASTAIGFGYFGAGINTYDAFFAKGLNVELPANTPVLLSVDERQTSPPATVQR